MNLFYIKEFTWMVLFLIKFGHLSFDEQNQFTESRLIKIFKILGAILE